MDDVARMSTQTRKYNQIILQMSERFGAVIVDFSDSKLFIDSATLDSDGNHPNSKGYDAIAEIWYQAIIGP
jgi:lysophospholipase L1-like esterase